jgi:hypothetical protein
LTQEQANKELDRTAPRRRHVRLVLGAAGQFRRSTDIQTEAEVNGVVAVAVVTAIGLAACWWRRSRRAGRSGVVVPSPILAASDLQRRYGLYAESGPTIQLDPQKVPPELRDLVPLAEVWGIGDDIIRFDFEQKASDAARRELVSTMSNRLPQVQGWLDGQRDAMQMSEEAVAFMYLLSAVDEVRFSRPE